MSDPTKAQLQTKLAAAENRVAVVEKQRASIDEEAQAYNVCVKALANLTTTGSYASSGRNPDTKAIQRVIDSLSARYGLRVNQESADGYLAPDTWEPEPDPRDIVIAQLIDALRKS